MRRNRMRREVRGDAGDGRGGKAEKAKRRLSIFLRAWAPHNLNTALASVADGLHLTSTLLITFKRSFLSFAPQ